MTLNTKKYYLYQILKNFKPIYPMMLILFENNGLTILESSLLMSIWSVPVVILEVPSGILADKWSRKYMIIIGNFLTTACFAIWIFGDSFFIYALGFVLWGIGLAFCSGAEEALIYDSMKSEGTESTFDKVLGRGRFLSGTFMAVACFFGGFIAAYLGMKWTLIISVITGCLSLIVILSFKEVNLFLNSERKTDTDRLRLTSMLRDVGIFFRTRKSLLILAVLAITVIGTSGILDEFDSLIAKGFGLSLEAVGIWISVKYVIMAIGSLIGPYLKTVLAKLLRIKRTLHIISIICITAGILLGLSGAFRQIWAMGLYAVFYLLIAAGDVLAEDYLQQRIEEEGRSTVHSVISMAYNLFGIIFYGSLGIVFRLGDLFSGLVVIAVYIFLMTGLLCVLDRKT